MIELALNILAFIFIAIVVLWGVAVIILGLEDDYIREKVGTFLGGVLLYGGFFLVLSVVT